MKTLLVTSVIVVSLLASGPVAQAPPSLQLQRHEFVIRNFQTESGIVLPEARVVYTTLGTLNAARDNAVLLPSHYMANFNGYNWLIGAQDRALDPSRDFLVLTELFGNGRSSSPSNTPEPFHGPRFPVMTIRDNVEAVHRLLTEELKRQASARGRRVLDGRRAGVSVGGELPDVHGRDRRDVRNGEMLRPRLRAARRTDRRADDRSRVAGRRLRSAAGERPRSVQHGLGRLAVLAGMVAPGAVAHEHARGHDVRSGVAGVPQAVQRGRERLHSAGAHVAASRRRDDARVRRRRRAGAAIDQGARRSTCRPKRICTFRSPTHATSRRSSRA